MNKIMKNYTIMFLIGYIVTRLAYNPQMTEAKLFIGVLLISFIVGVYLFFFNQKPSETDG